ncbi:MAG: GNAT family N-acetyltransferase [Hyphomicrobiales bacterium]|nr:GNAT family N-acetyltransferase [Hyphomicrobiales bacterium]
MEELGELTFSVHIDDQRLLIVEEFLQLEMQGWKGEAGTALLSHAKSANFARKFLGNAKYPEVRIEALRLDGRAIAMSMHIVAEGNAYHYKPTYDKKYARYSPAVLLHRWTMQQMFETKWAHHIDSATAADSQLGSIWKNRVSIGEVMFAASSLTPSVMLGIYAVINHVLQNIKPTLKKIIH